jgi:hypothetical protein
MSFPKTQVSKNTIPTEKLIEIIKDVFHKYLKSEPEVSDSGFLRFYTDSFGCSDIDRIKNYLDIQAITWVVYPTDKEEEFIKVGIDLNLLCYVE